MKPLVEQLDAVIGQILLKAENQNELLLGSCQSEVKLTNTQEHILMLVDQERLKNAEIAKRLKISQAAVTKAVQGLLAKGMLEAVKDNVDGRVSYFHLTEAAKPIAAEHHHHHHHTFERYENVLARFSEEEQATIERFLTALSETLED